MNKRFMTSAKGLTLVELLISLALIGMISVLVVSVLSSGMKSFKNINDDVSLHDEANVIMTSFANEIFVATSVLPADMAEDDKVQFPVTTKLVKISKYGEEEKVLLGFRDEQAKIGNNAINSTTMTVLERSYITINKDTVLISLTVQDKNEKEITLTSEVSYVNVENE